MYSKKKLENIFKNWLCPKFLFLPKKPELPQFFFFFFFFGGGGAAPSPPQPVRLWSEHSPTKP